MGTTLFRSIVLSLRNFSRLDETGCKAVDIHEGLESTLLILGNRIKDCNNPKGIEIIKNYQQIPLIDCYPAQLNQVFMNLLANALDAIEEAIKAKSLNDESPDSRPTYKIWISTQLNEQEQVELRIRDNGIGLKEAIVHKVFDHFFTTKPVGKGTGLGLAIFQKNHYGKAFWHTQFKRHAWPRCRVYSVFTY